MVLPMSHRFLLAILGSALLAPAMAGGQEAPRKPFQEYVHPLKGNPEDAPRLTLIGPEARDFVKREPDGLRITLPPGFDGERKNHGFNSDMVVHGDFEITARFEALNEPGPGQ